MHLSAVYKLRNDLWGGGSTTKRHDPYKSFKIPIQKSVTEKAGALRSKWTLPMDEFFRGVFEGMSREIFVQYTEVF